MKSYSKFILILLALLSLPLAPIAKAQTPSSIDGVDVSTNPDTPSPGENITVTVQSFNIDLNAASIGWVVDGKAVAKGMGVTSIKTFAPPLGKTSTVLISILTAEGKVVRKSITLKSGGVDLIWESQGYVPPFYKSKALYDYQNTVKVIAIPHLADKNGLEIDPQTLVYKWKEGDTVIQDQSGYGKQTLTIEDDTPKPEDVTVSVSTRTGDAQGTAELNLTPGNPSITFYEEDPLYGVLYNRAIVDRYSLTNPELTVRAAPYGFNTPLDGSNISYTWSINNYERTDLSTNQSVTLRTTGDTAGSSNIALDIRNTTSILQGAQNTVVVNFDKKPQ